ncbi:MULTISPECIES: hypothetical protein [Streptomyces]|uniref:Secreted protein n=1 Tax=Streptomyces spororaveus TaxID=284039 RepID=A0ABQ3TQ64_9ACTN|nr:hypothetical protein [Streptomyces spororaveus]GHI82513.1 hypothetical protein Sspor_80740 [Streptomyces spororaveus]
MTDRLEYPTPAIPAITALRRWAPPPALVGFLALLAVMFAAAYGVGASAGPVAPGMHSTDVGDPVFEQDFGRPHGHTGGAGGAR